MAARQPLPRFGWTKHSVAATAPIRLRECYAEDPTVLEYLAQEEAIYRSLGRHINAIAELSRDEREATLKRLRNSLGDIAEVFRPVHQNDYERLDQQARKGRSTLTDGKGYVSILKGLQVTVVPLVETWG